MNWSFDFLRYGGKLPDKNLDPPEREEAMTCKDCFNYDDDKVCVITGRHVAPDDNADDCPHADFRNVKEE